MKTGGLPVAGWQIPSPSQNSVSASQLPQLSPQTGSGPHSGRRTPARTLVSRAARKGVAVAAVGAREVAAVESEVGTHSVADIGAVTELSRLADTVSAHRIDRVVRFARVEVVAIAGIVAGERPAVEPERLAGLAAEVVAVAQLARVTSTVLAGRAARVASDVGLACSIGTGVGRVCVRRRPASVRGAAPPSPTSNSRNEGASAPHAASAKSERHSNTGNSGHESLAPT